MSQLSPARIVTLTALRDVPYLTRNERRLLNELVTSLSDDELTSGVVTPETKTRFNLRARRLTQLLPVEVAPVYGRYKRTATIQVATYDTTGDTAYVLHQSDSIHFKSCMTSGATGNKVYPMFYADMPGDINSYVTGALHIAYIGEPWHVDKRGYIARAKLRPCYVNGTVVAVCVDRLYGDIELFTSNLRSLENWVLQYYGKRVPLVTYTERGATGLTVDVPSTASGYQDTLSRGTTRQTVKPLSISYGVTQLGNTTEPEPRPGTSVTYFRHGVELTRTQRTTSVYVSQLWSRLVALGLRNEHNGYYTFNGQEVRFIRFREPVLCDPHAVLILDGLHLEVTLDSVEVTVVCELLTDQYQLPCMLWETHTDD